jgi:hypothetical protein
VKRAICRMQHVAVRGRDYGRDMGFGAEVDLDELVAPGLTLEQALGEHAERFEVIEPLKAAAGEGRHAARR